MQARRGATKGNIDVLRRFRFKPSIITAFNFVVFKSWIILETRDYIAARLVS